MMNKTPPRATEEDRIRAFLARQEQKAHWSALPLRQHWADEGFMVGHLKAAGLRSPDHTEPATVPRLSKLLRRAGVLNPEACEAVGCSLPQFLAKNPDLPLWGALALVLEACGRFVVISPGHPTTSALPSDSPPNS